MATEATLTDNAATASFAEATMSGYTQTAAVDGVVRSVGSGWTAFAPSARTLPGVSAPSSVVRSTIEMARSMAYAFAVVLMERVPSAAARVSRPTVSTPGSPWRKRRSVVSDEVTSGRGGAAVGALVGMVTRRAYLRA